MKKITTVLLALALAGFSYASPATKKALKSYEECVIAMEKAAEKNDIAALLDLEQKAITASEDLDKVKDDLTTEEALQFSKLVMRAAEAANKMTGNIQSMDLSLYGL